MKQPRKWILGGGLAALVASIAVVGLWVGGVLPDGVFEPPIRRGPPPAKMKEVRAKLYRELSDAGLKPKAPVFVRIFKRSRELELWMKSGHTYRLAKTWRICTYSGDLGPKLKRGDYQAPEGFYSVAPRQMNPRSSYHLAFNVGYPNRYDRAHRRTGSAIMVHGNCVSAGCFAMTNDNIQEIYALTEDALVGGQAGFAVHIFPFRMTPDRLARFSDARWNAFWGQLKAGYDAFEQTRVPPRITVSKGHYVVRGRGRVATARAL